MLPKIITANRIKIGINSKFLFAKKHPIAREKTANKIETTPENNTEFPSLFFEIKAIKNDKITV